MALAAIENIPVAIGDTVKFIDDVGKEYPAIVSKVGQVERNVKDEVTGLFNTVRKTVAHLVVVAHDALTGTHTATDVPLSANPDESYRFETITSEAADVSGLKSDIANLTTNVQSLTSQLVNLQAQVNNMLSVKPAPPVPAPPNQTASELPVVEAAPIASDIAATDVASGVMPNA